MAIVRTLGQPGGGTERLNRTGAETSDSKSAWVFSRRQLVVYLIKAGTVLDRLRRDERGSVLVTFTVMIAILLGFAALATDAGTAYWNRRMLQDGADAAALAGAASLPNNTAGAVATAQAVATENGITASELSAVSNNPQVTTIYNANDSIVVSAQRADTNGLRYVSGGGDLTIGSGATAIVVAMSPSDVWPIAVQTGTPCGGTGGCTIKYGAGGDSYSGNFGFVDFDITGSGDVGTYILDGYTGTIPAPSSYGSSGSNSNPVWNWSVKSEPGNKVSGTSNFQTLLDWDAAEECDGGTESCASLYVSPPDSYYYPSSGTGRKVCYTDIRCPRVGIIPLISQSWSSINGKKTITVVGFQCYYLQQYVRNGQGVGQDTIQARSLSSCNEGTGTGSTAYYNASLSSTGAVGIVLWK